MTEIRTESGKLLNTQELPPNWEPVFCSICGCRLGWMDTGFSDLPVLRCDDCMADINDEEE